MLVSDTKKEEYSDFFPLLKLQNVLFKDTMKILSLLKLRITTQSQPTFYGKQRKWFQNNHSESVYHYYLSVLYMQVLM